MSFRGTSLSARWLKSYVGEFDFEVGPAPSGILPRNPWTAAYGPQTSHTGGAMLYDLEVLLSAVSLWHLQSTRHW